MGEGAEDLGLSGPGRVRTCALWHHPLRSRVPTQEVSSELPLLDSAGVKMSELEDIIASRLEVEGCILAEAVAEHVLMCFCSQDP
jgi:hypothetical protein